MHHFFTSPGQVRDGRIRLEGPDVNHIKNVLRIKPGEKILVSDGTGKDYACRVAVMEDKAVVAVIESVDQEGRELPSKIWLFQGLPKADKMELIIQKAVELGTARIVPLVTKNAVVKLDGKKEAVKRARWQAIAESAAKQSRRSVMPQIMEMMNLKAAFGLLEQEHVPVRLIPYEQEAGMEGARQELSRIVPGQDIGVFIGPEGGFDESEIALALKHGVRPVSLGKRILRTETAGLAVLSVIMMRLEGAV